MPAAPRRLAEAQRLHKELYPEIAALLAGPPGVPEQQALLNHLHACLAPILEAHRVPAGFLLLPGPRLRSRYGQCKHFPDGRSPEVHVRCTVSAGPVRWRALASIAGTLIHEIAHLRHPYHRPRFWAHLRRLLDQAAAAGIYDPAAEDPEERGQGDGKLAGSAGAPLAEAAGRRRRQRYAQGRAAIASWKPGDAGCVAATRGALAGAWVKVIAVRRTRLEVLAPDGRRYLMPAALLTRSTAVQE